MFAASECWLGINIDLESSFKKVRFKPYNWSNWKSNGGHFLLIKYNGLWW